MYAIARIAGKQFRLEPDQKLKVPRLPLEVGASYEITDVLLTADGDKVLVGSPRVAGIKAVATVLKHGRDPKIMVLHKKRRKGLVKLRGHRQGYTLLHIEKIEGLAEKPKAKGRKKKAESPSPQTEKGE